MCVRLECLDKWMSCGQQVGEARALYNLGNMWHAKAKKMGCAGSQDPGELPQQVRQCLTNAASLYQSVCFVFHFLSLSIYKILMLSNGELFIHSVLALKVSS